MNYWLHRISHCYELAKPLLDKGYLSIGFSEYMKVFPAGNQAASFEADIEKIYGANMYSRHSLNKFLFSMKTSDVVLVPSWGTFSLYKIVDEAIPVSKLNLKKSDMPKDVTTGLFVNHNGDVVDIGFVIKVQPIAVEIPRREYCESILISRMKVRQTTADITNLADNIENAKTKFITKRPIQIKLEIYNEIEGKIVDILQRMSNPDELEAIVAQYFEKIGADNVDIPPKNEPGKKDGADADVVATFEAIKCVVYVQVKHHKDITSDWAVDQINKYAQQKSKDSDEYTYLSWVVSTGKFSEKTQDKARNECVRLISGKDLAGMLLEAGFSRLQTNRIKPIK